MKMEAKLALIASRFEIESIVGRQGTIPEVARYYAVNRLAYRLFHNRAGFIHMGITRTGVYTEDDLLAQARFVASVIKEVNAKSVLELAYGQGANSRYLARIFSDVSFAGIDLAHGQANVVKRKNLSLDHGDYHDLSRFADASLDVVFVIEALCHSTKKATVFSEVYRVLRPGGRFVVIDAYRVKQEQDLSDEEKIAVALVEKGMMVAKIEEYSSFKETISESGFKIVEEDGVTPFIMPTLRRFETQAFRYFKRGWLMRVINALLPREFTGNVVSGLLMPDMIERGIAIYTILNLKK